MLNTNHKILIARILYTFVMCFRCLFSLPAHLIKKRRGIKWSLDLREGIDLAIYVLGGFEVRTLRVYKKLIRLNDVVLDIGANIGAHTLPLAQLVGDMGKVIAFEPTDYAFNKLEKNLRLNPHLASRVTPCHMMLVNSELKKLPSSVYSSWPLETAGDLHKHHGGRLMPIKGASLATLDQYVQSLKLQRLNFIKLDVDGNEYDVLISGQETLKEFKPVLILELAPWVYEACPDKFDKILQLLWDLGYEITPISNGNVFPHDPVKVRHLIPSRGGINALATHHA
jgi:FkbM family methyltransferase